LTAPPPRDGSVDPTPGPLPVFTRAAFLPELRRARAAAPPQAPLATVEATEATIEATIEAWRQAAQLTPAQFDELLAAEGLGRTDLAQILSEREHASAPRQEPAWQATLRAVLCRIGDGSSARSLAPAAAKDPPFAAVLDGFVAVAWDDLRARAPHPASFDIDWTALAPRLQAHLRTLLLQICQRTLVLELNVARLEGWLEGDTPAARYACYVGALRAQPRVWIRLLDEYQVMARLLCTTMSSWVDGVRELLAHLVTDYPRLTAPPASPDASRAAAETLPALLPDGQRLRLVDLVGGLSDPHRGGRGVWKLSFLGGPGGEAVPPSFPLVYKPRSLAVDVHFQALLGFCNRAARTGALGLAGLRHAALTSAEPGFPELRLLRLVDCGDHGWVELVPRRDCADAGAAVRFYLRQGAYLALLYVLDGADVHYENVIADGEHPMLVDLETLFHPYLPSPEDEATRAGGAGATARAQAILQDSVMRTALLPGRAWGDRDRAGVNIGGLGDGRAQLSPRATLDWALARTDAMHATERRFEVPPGDNVPRVGGEVVPVSHHVEALVAGFEAMMRFLTAERAALLAPGGPIHAFADDPMRRLLRSTSVYAHLLETSGHPDHLRDALDRERLFDLLWKVSQGKPALLLAIAREKEDLRHGDVPYFSAHPSSCDLWDSRGERIPGWFAAPALQAVGAQLAARGERELGEQVFILRGAVSASSITTAAPATSPAAPLSSHGRTALDAAIAIGERIAATAILGERDATWLGMTTSRDGAGVDLTPLRGGLYDGTGGIALFLGYLGHVTGEDRFTRLAARAARVTRAALDGDHEEPSGFSGTVSHLYALSHLAALWGDRALVPPLGPILERTAAQLAADTRFDVIHGAAGCILALLALHALTGDEQAVSVAAAASRPLMAGAERGAAGASWPCTVSSQHLLGFSHGAAGIGAALLRLSHAASRRSELGVDPAALAALAEAAFDFERSRFDAAAGNWPDLREHAGGTLAAPRFMLAYCHGAPGIALSRLAALPLEPGAPARREIEIAVETTLAGRVQDGQTLCHGELGNLMIVQRAAALLGRADWQAQVDRRLGVTLARLFERGPACSFDFPPSAPALMDGIAGIGYGLLYLSRPAELPYVLDLSPLPARRSVD
jgi:type 2 lantibiotic biosynthesis protein LanM